jgi:hypothetical protein
MGQTLEQKIIEKIKHKTRGETYKSIAAELGTKEGYVKQTAYWWNRINPEQVEVVPVNFTVIRDAFIELDKLYRRLSQRVSDGLIDFDVWDGVVNAEDVDNEIIKKALKIIKESIRGY